MARENAHKKLTGCGHGFQPNAGMISFNRVAGNFKNYTVDGANNPGLAAQVHLPL
jgi:hypothetical protein